MMVLCTSVLFIFYAIPIIYIVIYCCRLYLNNINFNVNALYPPIEYPVSRGTPYLAPLITWNHDEKWFGEFENVLQLVGYYI